jgi:hypothetical protein
MASISAPQDLDFTKAGKFFIPNYKKTHTTSRFRFEDTTPNFKIAMPRVEGNNMAYYFELKDEVCVCGCWVCKTVWPNDLKYAEKGRSDNCHE